MTDENEISIISLECNEIRQLYSDDQRVQELIETLLPEFIYSLNLVFDNDWEATKDRIISESFITEDGTFLDPNIDDESNNWWNRGSFLSRYRKIRQRMDELRLTFKNE